MGKQSLWSKIKDYIHHIIWRLYCGVVLEMSDEEYYGSDVCPLCGTRIVKDENGEYDESEE